jgi:type II secretory pathway component HofQ
MAAKDTAQHAATGVSRDAAGFGSVHGGIFPVQNGGGGFGGAAADAGPMKAMAAGSFGGGAAVGESSVKMENGLVSVDFDHVPLHQAIRDLAKGAHINFVLNSAVLSDNVTMTLNRVEFTDALSKIFAAIKQPLTYRIEGGIFVIAPKD